MMRYLLVLVLLFAACSSAPQPLEPPTIVLECKGDDATIRLSSPTPILTPLITIPRFPDGSNPVRYQLKDFAGLSEVLELSWCPVSVSLEYSRVYDGERFKVVR